jgi:hypothetical protein
MSKDMKFSKTASLRDIAKKHSPKPPAAEQEKQASNVMGPEPPPFEAFKMPDDKLHHLWHIYKFGDGPPGNGKPDPGDKRIRGQLMGHFKGYMHDAVRPYEKQIFPGAAQQFVRDTIYRSFDRYNPESGNKLSTFVYEQVFPKPLRATGGSVAGRLVSQLSQARATTSRRQPLFVKYRRFIDEFKDQNGRPPSNREISDGTGIPLKDVVKMAIEGIDQIDTDKVTNDDDVAADRSIPERDAIWTVYASQTPIEQKVMEYMFPEILGGQPPPVDINKGGNKWMAEQLGVPDYKVSRVRSAIKDQVQEQLKFSSKR